MACNRLVEEGSFAYSSLAAGRKGTPSRRNDLPFLMKTLAAVKMARF